MKNKLIIISIVIIFVSFFILLNWNSFGAPFERDEGEYAYSAWLLHTGSTPYQDSFIQKPPLIIYTYYIGQIISPFAVWPPRVLAAIFVFLTAILIGLIAWKEWGKFAGVFSAFLFLPLISFPPLAPFAANTEKFMILPMMALLALFVYFKNSRRTWPYVLAGILSTFAIFYKPICLFVILFIIIFWLFELYRFNANNYKAIVKPILLIGGSAIVTVFILLIPFLKVLPNFFQEVFKFNISYLSSYGNPFGNLGNYLGKFFHYWWILLILPFGLFFKKPHNFFYYSTLLIISLLTIFSTPIGHYYLILMPFLALICGALFGSFIELFSTEKQKFITTIIVLPLVLYIMLFPLSEQFALSPQGLSEWVYGTVDPFGESKEVAGHLAQITKPNDFVFVAGSEPQIYYYAERKSSTRFDITFPLNLPTPYREQFQNDIIKDLEKNSPMAIVVSQKPESNLWEEGSPDIFMKYFSDLVSKNYKVVGGYVWDENGGHWQEPINDDSIKDASLLLFVKNK
jgi:hypothetical protein